MADTATTTVEVAEPHANADAHVSDLLKKVWHERFDGAAPQGLGNLTRSELEALAIQLEEQYARAQAVLDVLEAFGL